MISQTLEDAVALLQQDARQLGLKPAELIFDPVLCEDGRTVLIYAHDDEIHRSFGPIDRSTFDPAEIIRRVLFEIRRPKLRLVHNCVT